MQLLSINSINNQSVRTEPHVLVQYLSKFRVEKFELKKSVVVTQQRLCKLLSYLCLGHPFSN